MRKTIEKTESDSLLDRIARNDMRGGAYYWDDEQLAIDTALERKYPTTEATPGLTNKIFQNGVLRGKIPKDLLRKIQNMDTRPYEL